MYEAFYGFVEKPFSLTPGPKFLFRSESHVQAMELLQHALERGEGFVVITGDGGTGKTTLCQALLEQVDRKTFIALLPNPFLSEEDLLKEVLRDLGVISRGKGGAVQVREPTKQDLVNIFHEFLLSLAPLAARAVLVVDEAQSLPLSILEQIRVLSNLETDDRLLQIVLVGQPELMALLKSRDLRQLDQRISVRYRLKPLSDEEVSAYVIHRLAIAKGLDIVFTPGALRLVHELTDGVPRLVNMLCDRALLAGYSLETHHIDESIVTTAAQGLDLKRAKPASSSWLKHLFGRRSTP